MVENKTFSRRQFFKCAIPLLVALGLAPEINKVIQAAKPVDLDITKEENNRESKEAFVFGDNISPHYKVKDQEGNFVDLPESAVPQKITSKPDGKAIVEFFDKDQTYYLDPLAIVSNYYGESPLERLKRFQQNLGLEADIDLTNKELLHSANFIKQTGSSQSLSGKVYDIRPDGYALVQLSLPEVDFEPSQLPPTLALVPAGLINEEVELHQNQINSSDRQSDKPPLSEPSIEPSKAKTVNSFWFQETGYQFDPYKEDILGATNAETMGNIVRFAQEKGISNRWITDTAASLGVYLPFSGEVKNIRDTSMFVVKGDVYIPLEIQNGPSVESKLMKVSNNASSIAYDFTQHVESGGRVACAMVLPDNPNFILASIIQPSGTNNSLLLVNSQEPKAAPRHVNFEEHPDLFLLYPQITKDGKALVVTRYGGGTEPLVEGLGDEGGGHFVVDVADLTQKVTTTAEDITLKSVQISAFSHAFNLTTGDSILGFEVESENPTIPPESESDFELFLPQIFKPGDSMALTTQKSNEVKEFGITIPAINDPPDNLLGKTSGWDPVKLLVVRGTDGLYDAFVVHKTYPRTYYDPDGTFQVLTYYGLVVFGYNNQTKHFTQIAHE